MQAEHTTESLGGVKASVRRWRFSLVLAQAPAQNPMSAFPSQPVGSVAIACLLISVLFHSLNSESSENLDTF